MTKRIPALVKRFLELQYCQVDVRRFLGVGLVQFILQFFLL